MPLPCLLCKSREVIVHGVFHPSDQAAVGAPVNKIRVLRYSLCLACHLRADIIQAVEAKIFGELAAFNRVN
jgi:hypothetical protein